MIKVVSKPQISPFKENMLRLFAVLISFLCAALLMRLMGYDPMAIFEQIIKGSLNPEYRANDVTASNDFMHWFLSIPTNGRFQRTIERAVPLLILSLGIAVAFKMKFWNIGAEGQFYAGAFGACLVGFQTENLPPIVLIPLMMITAFLFAGIWGLIPAVLKLKYSSSETLITLMLNYVAILWIAYLQYGPWNQPGSSGKIRPLGKNAILPEVFGIHIGWIIALILVVIVYVIFKYTKLGYEISVIGESENTARYAGMNVSKITLTSLLISGGLCGIAGMLQVTSTPSVSLSNNLSGGLGFTAVVTTWLAKLSPPVAIVTSLLFAMLIQGSSSLQLTLKISPSVSNVLQGIIIFFVLASEFFLRYKIVFSKKEKEAK